MTYSKISIVLCMLGGAVGLVPRTLPRTVLRATNPCRATPQCILEEARPMTAPVEEIPFTIMKKDIKMPDPIPREGIEGATALMETGKLYRYNVPTAEESVVSQCEVRSSPVVAHCDCRQSLKIRLTRLTRSPLPLWRAGRDLRLHGPQVCRGAQQLRFRSLPRSALRRRPTWGQGPD